MNSGKLILILLALASVGCSSVVKEESRAPREYEYQQKHALEKLQRSMERTLERTQDLSGFTMVEPSVR